MVNSGNYSGCAEVTMCVMREEDEIELTIKGSSYFQHGRLSGPPEDCYPDEGETEILEIMHEDKLWIGELTKAEIDKALELLSEAVAGAGDDDPDVDYDDNFSDGPY